MSRNVVYYRYFNALGYHQNNATLYTWPMKFNKHKPFWTVNFKPSQAKLEAFGRIKIFVFWVFIKQSCCHIQTKILFVQRISIVERIFWSIHYYLVNLKMISTCSIFNFIEFLPTKKTDQLIFRTVYLCFTSFGITTNNTNLTLEPRSRVLCILHIIMNTSNEIIFERCIFYINNTIQRINTSADFPIHRYYLTYWRIQVEQTAFCTFKKMYLSLWLLLTLPDMGHQNRHNLVTYKNGASSYISCHSKSDCIYVLIYQMLFLFT